MPRYFIEVSYKGTHYSGFQVQENAITIQSEVEKAFSTLHRSAVQLTGSSRTDAGVHALQNFFHFDFEGEVHQESVYKMNAILPKDIAVHQLHRMPAQAHARFDAVSREYIYRVHRFKNPFLEQSSFYYPYKLDLDAMHKAAVYLQGQQNFFAFAKTNSQVKNYNCLIYKSQWTEEADNLIFTIKGNRFLRGMVRLITATLLKLGRQKLSFAEYEALFYANRKSVYSVPAHGLYLAKVDYPDNYFDR